MAEAADGTTRSRRAAALLRVGYAGTPAFASQALAAVLDAGHAVPLVLTQPDRPAGRGLKLQASPVKQLALSRGLPLAQPRGLRLDGRHAEDAAAARAALEAAAPDVLVVAAYGLILPAWLLALPRLGCVNIHGSLLPRWRGAAPIQRAIEAGDEATGITIMQMDAGLDTGPMLLTEATGIGADDTAATLHDRLAETGSRLIVQALRDLQAGTLTATPQPGDGATYAHKIEKSESPIDWRVPAAVIERRLRAFDPFPGATAVLAGQTVKVWRGRAVARAPAGAQAGAPGAQVEQVGDVGHVRLEPGQQLHTAPGRLLVQCGDGALELLELQPAGGTRITAREFLQRHPQAAA